MSPCLTQFSNKSITPLLDFLIFLRIPHFFIWGLRLCSSAKIMPCSFREGEGFPLDRLNNIVKERESDGSFPGIFFQSY